MKKPYFNQSCFLATPEPRRQMNLRPQTGKTRLRGFLIRYVPGDVNPGTKTLPQSAQADFACLRPQIHLPARFSLAWFGRCKVSYFVAFIAALCVALTAPSAHAQTISADKYRQLLTDYQRAAKASLSASDAAALRKRFERAKTVATSGTSTVPVDNAKEIAALRAIESGGTKAIAAADKERATLLQALNAPLPQAIGGRDPRSDASAILAADEFRPAQLPTAQKTWFAQWMESVNKQWMKWWRSLFGKAPKLKPIPGLAEFVFYLLIALLVAAALVGLFFLARFFVDRYGGPERKAKSGGQGVDLLLDIADPLGEAQRVAALGDYRTALRLAYIASLRRLAGAGLIVLQENHTNWEYQTALRRRSEDSYKTLLPATRLFDNVWYGDRPASATEYQAVVAAHDALPKTANQAAALTAAGEGVV